MTEAGRPGELWPQPQAPTAPHPPHILPRGPTSSLSQHRGPVPVPPGSKITQEQHFLANKNSKQALSLTLITVLLTTTINTETAN